MSDDNKPVGQADRVIKQLNYLPATIARMGLGIAEAQKELDANFVKDLRAVLAMFRSALEDKDADGEPKLSEESKRLLMTIVEQFAPTRYQFTETTLEFRADLAESLDVGASLGLEAGVSAGIAAVSVSASASVAFGYDYNAAARITTVLHARPLDRATMHDLLSRADRLGQLAPPANQIDAAKQLDANVQALAKALPRVATT